MQRIDAADLMAQHSPRTSSGLEARIRRLRTNKKIQILLFLCSLLTASCDRFPLFNFIGQDENSSEDFLIKPILSLDQIKRVGSVYGTPGAGEGGVSHNGIDIGVDEGTPFIAGCPGIIINIAKSHDNYSEVEDVELGYNDEFSISYLFEPKKEIIVKEGDLIREGDIIGYVGSREAGYIDQCVHFWVKRKGQAVCPIPYLRDDLRKWLNDVYRSMGPREPLNICGCPEHQSYF